MRFLLNIILAIGVALFFSFPTIAEINVVDDTGRNVTLSRTAQRIISMAPNLTELLFHIGAGSQTVGVVEYSDFPEEVQGIPAIGTSSQFDIEAILALQPDLLVAWYSGNPAEDLTKLEDLGLVIFRSEPRTLNDVASLMKRLGKLAGHIETGEQLASDFLASTDSIRDDYQRRTNLQVFYQIWSDPIYTLNGDHLISRLIENCGGTNIFYALETLAPVVSTESVIQRNPDVIIAGGYGGLTPKWLETWNQWSSIKAVKSKNLYTVDTDQISRMGPRIVEGMQALCEVINTARSKL